MVEGSPQHEALHVTKGLSVRKVENHFNRALTSGQACSGDGMLGLVSQSRSLQFSSH